MSDKNISGEMTRWKKLGRRWIGTLGVMLSGNLCLILLALAGYGVHAPNTIAVEPGIASPDLVEQPSIPSDETNVVVQGESKSAAIPATTTVDLPSDDTSAAPNTHPISAPTPGPSILVTLNQETASSVGSTANTIIEPVAPVTKQDSQVAPQLPDIAGKVVIVNPASTGGAVHYVADGQVRSLQPGAWHSFDASSKKRFVYHKGDEQADAEHELAAGVFAFSVGPSGWTLQAVNPENVTQLLQNCRCVGDSN